MSDQLIHNEDIPTQIVPMILMALKLHLETAMVEEVPDTNPTRAILVKVGRFQDNPLNMNVSVSISGGDYEDPKYIDARIDNPNQENFAIKNLPVGELGGGHYWWRRGTINFQTFFVRQNFKEEVAMQYAYDFYGRLLRNVEDHNLGSLQDDYGEGVASTLILEGATFFESGGKDKFIWRGKLYWRILTWRP